MDFQFFVVLCTWLFTCTTWQCFLVQGFVIQTSVRDRRLSFRQRFNLRAAITEPTDAKDRRFIRESLLQNAQFSKLPQESIDSMVNNFEKSFYSRNEWVVEQGDSSEGDFVYMVGPECECTILVDNQVVPEPYSTLKARAVFGDLAVLYNETRAATISASFVTDLDNKKADDEKVVLYRIYGDAYKAILHGQETPEAYQQLSNEPGETVTAPSASSSVSLETLQQIDEAINEVSGSTTLYEGNIIPPYKPERLWLWKRWSKTILNVSYKYTLFNMLVCWLFLTFASHRHCASNCLSWRAGQLTPDMSLPFVQRLSLLHEIWKYQQGLTTFILTFFLSEAYGFWKSVYSLARSIQGRINDFQLLLATNIQRNWKDGSPTEKGRQFMDDVGRYTRLHHALLWASTARRFAVLNTPEGLERMASRNLMTTQELDVLLNLKGFTKLSDAPLQWMLIRSKMAMEEGVLEGGDPVIASLMDQACRLRAAFGTIGDKLSGRMPLAYTHFVQILVDAYVIMAPFALYSQLGNYSIFAVGLLTLFYTGLLNLAKIFLDPLNNEKFCNNSIYMDLGVLIRESNGGSIRWKNAVAKLPFVGQK